MNRVDSTLPAPRTVLIGRERELATVHAILNSSQTRLLTLTGVGGGGKSHFARHIASEISGAYPRRIWLVELAANSEPSLLPLTVATALGLRGVGGTSPLAALTAVLRASPAFLILDNCEHLIDACATLTEQLLGDCPELRILATSREPLQIAGERQYRLPTLETPNAEQFANFAEIAQSPAVQLFVARAQDVAPDFRLTSENASIVARVCADLDGLPLALELAAARVRVLGVEQILERLDDSIRLLTGGSRVAPTRQQTLRATLDWSDALLTGEERTVFQRLAIFAGAFSLEAAEAVCATAKISAVDVLDLLTRLVDKSLVVASMEANAAWYRLLEPVRQYAMGQLTESGEIEGGRDRHATFYSAYAEQAATALSGAEQASWLVRLDREQGNFRTALEWTGEQGDDETALRLAAALVPYWEARGYLAEGQSWLRQALDASDSSVDPTLRIRALRGAGRLAFLHAEDGATNYDEAEILHAESLRLAHEVGDEPGIAAALNEMGMVYRLQRDFERANDCLLDALARFRALDDAAGIALALLNLGTTASVQGDADRAFTLLQESIKRYQSLGDLRSIGIAQAMITGAAVDRGDLDVAFDFVVAAIEMHANLDDRWFFTFDLLRLASVLLEREQPLEAVGFLGTAQALSEALGCRVGAITFARTLGVTRPLLNEPQFAAAWDRGYAMSIPQTLDVARTVHLSVSQSATADASISTPLTRREHEVAAYLRLGYTDRQIADALFLSPGTVGVHVHHILGKLGLRSRLQVAEHLDAYGENNDPTP